MDAIKRVKFTNIDSALQGRITFGLLSRVECVSPPPQKTKTLLVFMVVLVTKCEPFFVAIVANVPVNLHVSSVQ